MFRLFIAMLMLAGCNSVYMKPGTLEPNTKVFVADRGGYTMRRSIKQRMEERGYTIVVGQAGKAHAMYDDENVEFDSVSVKIPADAKYFIKTRERQESFRPIWCVFNGFWWWNFNVSVADQKTGEEILTWRGRGCANSSLKKLDAILDKLESK